MNHFYILDKLQTNLLPFVKIVLILLVILLLVLLIIYAISVYMHALEKKYFSARKEEWNKLIERILTGKMSLNDISILQKDRKYFKRILVETYKKTKSISKTGIKEIYTKLKFLEEDIKNLKSGLWWKKTKAIGNLEDLSFDEAEDYVIPLLKDKKDMVRFAALRMLAAVKSKKLFDKLHEIIEDNTRWTYRYITIILFGMDVPVEKLEPFALSKNKDLKKVATILLGRKENRDALELLRKLAGDDVKDIRREVMRSLGRIGLPGGLPILAGGINDPHPQVRTAIAGSLGQINDKRVIPLLDKLADDPVFEVRYHAFFSLRKIGGSTCDVIRKYQGKYPDIVKEFLQENAGNIN